MLMAVSRRRAVEFAQCVSYGITPKIFADGERRRVVTGHYCLEEGHAEAPNHFATPECRCSNEVGAAKETYRQRHAVAPRRRTMRNIARLRVIERIAGTPLYVEVVVPRALFVTYG